MNKEKIPAGAATPAKTKTKSLVGNFKSNSSTPLPENTSAAAQRTAILKYLQAGNTLTTLHAREVMGVMHPGGRVMELRKRGYNIVTHRVPEVDASGTRHSVGHYVLFFGKGVSA